MLLEGIGTEKLMLLEKALRHRDVWRQVTEKLAESCDFHPIYDLKEQSANGLVLALLQRQVTLESMKECLLALDLSDIMSLICEPERLKIVRQPYCVESDDSFWEGDTLCVKAGGTLHLRIEAVGCPQPSFQWFRENDSLTCKGPDLIIHSFSEEMEGLYHCEVQQYQGFGYLKRIISEDVTIQIAVKIQHEAPRITSFNPTTEQTIECGQDLIASVEVSAYPKPEYRWWHGSKLLEGCTTNLLKIERVNFSHSGKYACRVLNRNGESCTDFSFQVVERKPLPTQKKALIIANSKYADHNLHTPHSDADTLKECLSQYDFECTVCKDLSTEDMRQHIKMFCASLKQGAYVLFYFGGHGFLENLRLYLMGCDAYISKPQEKHVVEEFFILDQVQMQKPLCHISILDMCQTSLDLTHLRPKQNQPQTDWPLIQCYATSPNRPALEKQGGVNSVYVKHLKDVLCKMKERPFQDMIHTVHSRVSEEDTGQLPEVRSRVGKNKFKLSDFRLSDPLLNSTLKDKKELRIFIVGLVFFLNN